MKKSQFAASSLVAGDYHDDLSAAISTHSLVDDIDTDDVVEFLQEGLDSAYNRL